MITTSIKKTAPRLSGLSRAVAVALDKALSMITPPVAGVFSSTAPRRRGRLASRIRPYSGKPGSLRHRVRAAVIYAYPLDRGFRITKRRGKALRKAIVVPPHPWIEQAAAQSGVEDLAFAALKRLLP